MGPLVALEDSCGLVLQVANGSGMAWGDWKQIVNDLFCVSNPLFSTLGQYFEKLCKAAL